MTKKIAAFTGSRAEYGLLYWLLKDIQASNSLQLQLLVSGMHLSPEFGETWSQIVSDGFSIDSKVEMLLSTNTSTGVVKSIGLGLIGFADSLEKLNPDILIVLGDRFEALAVAQAAMIMQIPIAHIHGGEITEGAYDDSIRHAITKMASLHFTSTSTHRNRVIQMGENPGSVFNFGAIGLDHLNRGIFFSKFELSKQLNFDLERPYFLVTYHPVTVGDESPTSSFNEIISALDAFPDFGIVITYPNADNGGRKIIPLIDSYAKSNPERVFVATSLGSVRYLSVLKNASAVIGNSSSGIIEAPSVCVPTVNVGIRQLGRIAAESVLNCSPERNSIQSAINVAVSKAFGQVCENTKNPYGQGHVSSKIVEVLEEYSIETQKKFYDVEF